MEYRQSHDVRAAALIALIRMLLFCDGHFRDSGNSLPQIEPVVMGSERFLLHIISGLEQHLNGDQSSWFSQS
jgi:hypothetical protein